ncbi:hypothetical protein B7494_g5301 [Chlorociboria aeruginascens]|nr:hypothetical protein B7494_g5301 [Chlorociboria aeruginascens]
MLRTIASSLNPLSRKSDIHSQVDEETEMATPQTISNAEFKEALGRYPALIKKLEKAPKPDVPTLEELDKYRYVDGPAHFSKKSGAVAFGLEEVQKLVDWKLRHGTYHPSISKFVGKNSNELVKSTTFDAFAHYAKSPSDIATVIKKLAEPLKGVGPATASLLLAVYDPDHVPFFSDEIYRWLVGGGDKIVPKYSPSEFETIISKTKALSNRLNVTPIQIEKVAFVLIQETKPVLVPRTPKVPSGLGRGRPRLAEHEKKAKKPTVPGRGRGRPLAVGGPKKAAATKASKAPKAAGAPAGKRGRPKAREDVAEEPTSTPAKKRKADDEDEETPRRSAKKGKA